jgi:hypothetical protein
MTYGDRYLMVIIKNKSSVVLECPDLSLLNNWKSKAVTAGAVCKRITIEEFYPTYRGYRYFDLRNPITRETFSVNEVLEILDAPLEDHGEAEDLFGGNIIH